MAQLQLLLKEQEICKLFLQKHLTDGSGADFLSKSITPEIKLNMNGAAVFQWTRRELGKQIRELMDESDF